MGPDEDHPNVDNNGFTNAAAQLAIRYKYTEEIQNMASFEVSFFVRTSSKDKVALATLETRIVWKYTHLVAEDCRWTGR